MESLLSIVTSPESAQAVRFLVESLGRRFENPGTVQQAYATFRRALEEREKEVMDLTQRDPSRIRPYAVETGYNVAPAFRVLEDADRAIREGKPYDPFKVKIAVIALYIALRAQEISEGKVDGISVGGTNPFLE